MNLAEKSSLSLCKPHTSRGRPKWIPNVKELSLVEELAGKGLTKEQIAACLGISYDTLNERAKELTDFSEAIKKGRGKAVYGVANALYQSAMSGNVTAMIFWLKCHAGWKEAASTEVSSNSGVLVAPERQGRARELLRQTLDKVLGDNL